MKTFRGVPASRGVAIGPAYHFRRASLTFERHEVVDTDAEWKRLQDALRTAREQLAAVHDKALRESGEEQAQIFIAQAEMLDDPELIGAMQTAIHEDRINAEAALIDASEQYAQIMESMGNEYFAARAADIRDVAQRVLRLLLNVSESPDAGLSAPAVILADDLTPSDTVLLDKSKVLGFCTAGGGATSHTAILARGLGIPAVVAAGEEALHSITDGDTLVVDGSEGQVIANPDPEVLQRYEARIEAARSAGAEAKARAGQPAVTTDGRQVEVVANIGNVESARFALQNGAEGVGLLRTEFLYLERDTLPSEEEQYQAYRAILDEFGQLPVILRTLDIGGDKELPYLQMEPEMNPFLGVRALRLSLLKPELFKPQLRAALRAGVDRNLKIMFPMVATTSEVRAARRVLDECRQELAAEGIPFADNIEIGIMVEIPSAALMADLLADEVDFFSIGTNDLTQYTMAADRTNGRLDYLASAFHPPVLRLIANVIEAAHRKGKWVGMCGELAGEPLAIPILLGLGLDEFSMNPPAIPPGKELIRRLSAAEAAEVARQALNMDDPEAIQALVRERYGHLITA